MDSVNV